MTLNPTGRKHRHARHSVAARRRGQDYIHHCVKIVQNKESILRADAQLTKQVARVTMSEPGSDDVL